MANTSGGISGPRIKVPLTKTAQEIGGTTVSGGGQVIMPAADFKKSGLPGASVVTAKTPSIPGVPVKQPQAAAPAQAKTPSVGQIAGNIKTTGNYVGARDYVSSKGYGGAVDWDGENVLVGGMSIKPAYVTNGTAYVDRAVMDDAISNYENKNGITAGKKLTESYMNGYGDRLEKLLRPLVEQQKFSYDPDKDEAYQTYRAKMQDNAEKAFRRVLNNNNMSLQTASGAVLAEAMRARDEYLKQADDALLDYRNNALNEYESDTSRMRNNLSDAYSLFNDFYNKQYQTNRDQFSDSITANELANKERQQDFENDITRNRYENEARQQAYENEQMDIRTPYELAAMQLQNIGAQLSNEQIAETVRHLVKDNLMTEAYTRGYLTPEGAREWDLDKLLKEDQYGRMVNPDGTVYEPWVPEHKYQLGTNYVTSYAQQAAANQANREFGQLQTQINSGAVNPYTPVASDKIYAALAALAGVPSVSAVPAVDTAALLSGLSGDPNTAALAARLQDNPEALSLLLQLATAFNK